MTIQAIRDIASRAWVIDTQALREISGRAWVIDTEALLAFCSLVIALRLAKFALPQNLPHNPPHNPPHNLPLPGSINK